MDASPSIRSSSRARTSERGFVLLAAIVLAVLYFGLMELLLLDSARELNEAQRFRSRVLATVLAENAAELTTVDLVNGHSQIVNQEDAAGSMKASLVSGGANQFEIHAEGRTKGVAAQHSNLTVIGEVNGAQIRINYTYHSQ